MKFRGKLVFSALPGLLLPCGIFAQSAKPVLSQASTNAESTRVRQFVQSFYDWYVPLTQDIKNASPLKQTLNSRPEAFSPELRQALQQDVDAQAKAEEIVGLDFDPFLNSQDPDPQYAVRSITRSGNQYRVQLFSLRQDRQRSGPDVIAIIENIHGHWQFVNFEYPQIHTNLVHILRELKTGRER